MIRYPIGAALVLAATLAGCQERAAPPVDQARPVRTTIVERPSLGESVSLTGQIRARDQAALAFRLDGRMIERLVRVGDVVTAGQVVARLDPQDQENALRSAQATLSAAQATLAQARFTFQRQQELLKNGWTSRARFDDVEQALKAAQAQVDSAQAQLNLAQDRLGYTTLTADTAGAVTAVGAESGEVVRAGQMVVEVAREGGLDAVFDVSEQIIRTAPRNPEVAISLTDHPAIQALGRVREVAPQADSATRTFRVKVRIIDPPPELRLGSTVTGRTRFDPPEGVEIPAGALTELDGKPAVWVVEPSSKTVALRTVAVSRYEPATVVVSSGLTAGETVVTAGVQSLHPGQKVRILGDA
jgi:RND family efflux transporter MFP subunit